MRPEAPPRPSRAADALTVEERLAELERLLGHVLARARKHPVGRRVLVYLGLK